MTLAIIPFLSCAELLAKHRLYRGALEQESSLKYVFISCFIIKFALLIIVLSDGYLFIICIHCLDNVHTCARSCLDNYYTIDRLFVDHSYICFRHFYKC